MLGMCRAQIGCAGVVPCRPAKVLEIGNSDPQDRCMYSEIDMVAESGVAGYSHRDGAPYPVKG